LKKILNFYRTFIVNISFEDDEAISDSESQQEETNTERTQENKEKDDDYDPGAPLQTEVFEVPEFLYKYSSTFFKKSSLKEKRIHKIFGKIDNKEKVKIQTDRPMQEIPEEEMVGPEKKSERYTGNTIGGREKVDEEAMKNNKSGIELRGREGQETPKARKRVKHLR